jgi:hypothetical protein
MEDKRTKCGYEFGDEQNQLLSGLSHCLHRLGVTVLVAGILLVAYLVISFADPVPLLAVSDSRSMALGVVDYALWILIALLVIYVSMRVIHLAKPIKLIVETKGADIEYLMHFVSDLTVLARTCAWALVVVCLLIAVSLTLLILVF